MTISLGTPVFSDDGGVGLASTFSGSITISAGSSIYCIVGGGATAAHVNPDTITVSDGTNNYVALDTLLLDAADTEVQQAFYVQNPGAGTYTVTATYKLAGSGLPIDSKTICLVEIIGGKTTGILDVHGPGQLQSTPTTGTDAVTSGAAQTNTVQPALVVGLSFATAGAGTPAAGTGYTSAGTGWGFGGTALARLESKRVTSLAGQQATFTAAANNQHLTTMAVFVELGAGAIDGSNLKTQQRAKGFPPRAPLPGIARLGLGILSATQPQQPSSATSTGSAATSSFDASGTGSVTFAATGSAAASSFGGTGLATFAIPAPFPSAQPMTYGVPSRSPARLPAPPPVLLGSGILVPTIAAQGASFTSAGSAAISPFATTGVGVLTFAATGSAALSPFASSGTGAEAFASTGTAAMSPFAVSGSGSGAFAGSGSAATSSFASSGTGSETFDGPGSAALSPFALVAAGTFAIPAPFPILQPTLYGFPVRQRGRVPKPVVIGYGLLKAESPPFIGAIVSSGSAALSSFGATAVGIITFASSGTAAASPFASSGTGTETFASTASAALSPFACSGAGSEAFASTGSAACSPFAASATGSEAFAGSGSAACQPFAASGTGTSGNNFNGSGSAALSPFAVTASGLETFASTGSAAVSPFASSSAGLETFTSSGSAACQPFNSAGNAAQGTVFTSSGSAAVSQFASSGTVAESFTSAGSSACSPFAASAAGLESFAGSGSAALSPFACSGSALSLLPITGTGSAALSRFGSSGIGIHAPPIFGTCTAAMTPFQCLGQLGGVVTTGPVVGFWRNDVLPVRGTWR